MPLPLGPIPMRLPRRSVSTRSWSAFRPRNTSDSALLRRPISSSVWSAGQSIPSWTRAKWMLHAVFAAINRSTFSTEPADERLSMCPRCCCASVARALTTA